MVRVVPGNQLSLNITGLTPFTNYTVYVVAKTVAVGERSPDITVITLEDGMAPHSGHFIVHTLHNIVIIFVIFLISLLGASV